MTSSSPIIHSLDTDSDNSSDGEAEWIPSVGMEFGSETHAYYFYNAYAFRIGFSVRRGWSNKSKVDDRLTSRKFVCSKEGIRGKDKRDHLVRSPRAETRTGCEAYMEINLNPMTDKYAVTKCNLEHNHFLVKEEWSHMLRSQRQINRDEAIDIELAADAGIPVRQAFELSSRASGGRATVGFMKVDVQNHLRSRRQHELERGEATWLTNYFTNQGCEDPLFQHAVQLDSEERITNVFWADSKMRNDYNQFGDVVTFDTTYKLVYGNRPFAIFLGLNNHRETTIFGAAFMYDETTESFTWVFKTLLKVMQNKRPRTILTDQDAAMAKALATVMPETKHLLCTWHLMQNVTKNLGNLRHGDVGIKSIIGEFMYGEEKVEEFESHWMEMLANYNLQENNWVANLYSLKHVWAYAYVKDNWTAGMRSTQLSESFNARLKQYLARQYKLPEFFRHFENLLHDKRYKESEAAYVLIQRLPRYKYPSSKILQQVGQLYTTKIFLAFQEELLRACMEEKVLSRSEPNLCGGLVYGIGRITGTKRFVGRSVNDHLICSCGKFGREGILCSHILKVLVHEMAAELIPERYIVRRWTAQASNGIPEFNNAGQMTDPRLELRRRHRTLCRYVNFISSVAIYNKDAFLKTLGQLKAIAEHFSVPSSCPPPPPRTVPVIVNLDSDDDTHILSPSGPTAKGFAKKDTCKGQRRRHIGALEKACARKKKMCAKIAKSQGNKINLGASTSNCDRTSFSVGKIDYVRHNDVEVPKWMYENMMKNDFFKECSMKWSEKVANARERQASTNPVAGPSVGHKVDSVPEFPRAMYQDFKVNDFDNEPHTFASRLFETPPSYNATTSNTRESPFTIVASTSTPIYPTVAAGNNDPERSVVKKLKLED